jgi:hypothetical protein
MNIVQPWRAVVLLWFLCGIIAGCGSPEPTRWDAAQEASEDNVDAVADDSVKGSSLNGFFPEVESPFDLVFKQEKTGFSQASLKADGKEVATLSISDTSNNPSAAAKYADSQEELAGFPVAAAGSKGTGLLVGDRFQVQIRSMDESFTESDRKDWLQKFDLTGLETQK